MVPTEPLPAPRPAHRRQRAAAATGVALVLLVGVVLALLGPVRTWASSLTGEESLYEGVKGVGALALLRLTGPRLDLAPMAPAAHLDVNPYGVNTFLQLEADPSVVRHTFEELSAANIGWIRQEFPWEDIEIQAKGDYLDRRNDPPRSAWDKYDTIVDLAQEFGIGLLVRLDNPPEWAFADAAASGEKGPPDDLADFGDFVATVAERYCGKVRYYQIWNEPNIYPEWGERDVDPAGYAALLKVAAERARAACPDVVIVSAALAPTTEAGGRNLNDLTYLAALYDVGWAPDFDILAAQGFGLWTGALDRRVSPDRANFARVELLRDIMVRHGDAEKPVWLTEIGWDSPPPGLKAQDATKYGVTTEAQRARYTTEAYQRMRAEWPWAGVAFVWYLRRPDWEWHQRPEGYFRLLEPDWQHTPTFDALAALAGERRLGARLAWGRHLPSDPAIRLTGPWHEEQDEAGRVWLGAKGAEAFIPFDGTGYELVVTDGAGAHATSVATATGASTMTAAPGEPAPNAAPAFSAFIDVDGITGTVRLAARALETAGEAGLKQMGLSNGEHTAIVRVDAGELTLREVLVAPAAASRPWWLVLLVVAVLAVGVAGAFVVARRRRGHD